MRKSLNNTLLGIIVIIAVICGIYYYAFPHFVHENIATAEVKNHLENAFDISFKQSGENNWQAQTLDIAHKTLNTCSYSLENKDGALDWLEIRISYGGIEEYEAFYAESEEIFAAALASVFNDEANIKHAAKFLDKYWPQSNDANIVEIRQTKLIGDYTLVLRAKPVGDEQNRHYDRFSLYIVHDTNYHFASE